MGRRGFLWGGEAFCEAARPFVRRRGGLSPVSACLPGPAVYCGLSELTSNQLALQARPRLCARSGRLSRCLCQACLARETVRPRVSCHGLAQPVFLAPPSLARSLARSLAPPPPFPPSLRPSVFLPILSLPHSLPPSPPHTPSLPLPLPLPHPPISLSASTMD